MRGWLAGLVVLTVIAGVADAADTPQKKPKPQREFRPHPVVRTFYVEGVRTDADVANINAAIRSVKSVTDATELTPTSGFVRVAFDTHVVTSQQVASAIMQTGDFRVYLRFSIPEYAAHAEKIDAVFERLSRWVAITPVDREAGEFRLEYLPIELSDSNRGFNFGHLGHAIHDPPPKGLSLKMKFVQAPRTRK